MKFDTGEDLLKFLQDNIRTSYKERYAGVDISPQRGSARRELKFRTSNRGDLHDSILELLRFNGIRNYTHKLSSHTVEVIDITYAPRHSIGVFAICLKVFQTSLFSLSFIFI